MTSVLKNMPTKCRQYTAVRLTFDILSRKLVHGYLCLTKSLHEFLFFTLFFFSILEPVQYRQTDSLRQTADIRNAAYKNGRIITRYLRFRVPQQLRLRPLKHKQVV